MAQEAELPMMAPPTGQAAPRPEDAVAKIHLEWLNREQAEAWLKSEEARAQSKILDGEAGHNMQGCRIQEEACAKLRNRITSWASPKATDKQKADEQAALAEPLDLEVELGQIKESLLPPPPTA